MASYKDSKSYKSLTKDEKKLADLYAGVSAGSSKYTTAQLKEALKLAKKDANGYMKQVLRQFETQVSADYAKETGDYQSHLDTINENIKEINQDLTDNSSFLGLQEQQALASQARQFEQEKGNVEQNLAATGLTRSTIGENRQKYVEDTNKGIVEGITSTYDKNLSELKKQADRGNIQAQRQLKDLERGYKYDVGSLGLKSEGYLGSEGVAKLGFEGYKPLGDITGSYKEDLTKDIANRQETYLNNARQSSLNF